MSACGDHETIEAAFAAGIDAFIPKPIDMQSFDETYRALAKKFNRKVDNDVRE